MLHGRQQWIPLLVSEKSLLLPLSGLLATGMGNPLWEHLTYQFVWWRWGFLLQSQAGEGQDIPCHPMSSSAQGRAGTWPLCHQPPSCIPGLLPASGDPIKHTASLELVSRSRHHGLVWFNSGYLVSLSFYFIKNNNKNKNLELLGYIMFCSASISKAWFQ